MSFGNATAASTTAAFSAAGSYTLQVVVSDGKATVSGSVVISVSSSTGGGDTLLSTHFDSGSDQFTYNDDTFLGTSRPIYASGSYDAAGGFSGGGLPGNLGRSGRQLDHQRNVRRLVAQLEPVSERLG